MEGKEVETLGNTRYGSGTCQERGNAINFAKKCWLEKYIIKKEWK